MDEELFHAVDNGSTAEITRLLAAGASPDGYREVCAMLPPFH